MGNGDDLGKEDRGSAQTGAMDIAVPGSHSIIHTYITDRISLGVDRKAEFTFSR